MKPEQASFNQSKETYESISSDDDYEILEISPISSETGHEMRERYLQLTADLIYHMQGFDSPEDFKPDTTIFLDKSARPVEWMVREFWTLFTEPVEEDGELVIPDIPDRKFLNIDREQWEHCFEEEMVDPHTSVYYFKKDRVKKSEIDELRSIFIQNLDPEIDPFEQEAILDNQRILVVDEVKLTGRTMTAAKKLLGMAFRGVELDGHHWMNPEIVIDLGRGVRKNKESPVWYSDKDNRMRGVDNRDPSENLFLSTRFAEVDKKSLQLRGEIKQLANDYKEGKYSVLIGEEIIRDRLEKQK